MKLIEQKTVAIALCSMILAGCSAKKDFVNLPDNVRSQITNTQGLLIEPSKTIAAEIETSQISSYTGGGLLFALVDCAIMDHRQDRANDVMKELQKDFESYNLRDKLKDKIHTSLAQAQWLHANSLDYTTELDKNALKEIIKNTKSDCVLVSQFIYSMSPQFDGLSGRLYVTLYPSSDKIKKSIDSTDLETPIYKFNVFHSEKLPQATTCLEENSKIWVQNEGYYLKNTLDKIVDQIIIKLNEALQNPNKVEKG